MNRTNKRKREDPKVEEKRKRGDSGGFMGTGGGETSGVLYTLLTSYRNINTGDRLQE